MSYIAIYRVLKMTDIKELQAFRERIHLQCPKRKGAIMDLLDALSSYGHRCNSVVQLSKAECYERQYSSITDAIADGLKDVDWGAMIKVLPIVQTNFT